MTICASPVRHKVFISYHHANDQYYKEELLKINEAHQIFIDCSVGIDEIDDNLPDETIRERIRDEYLRDSTVTILLVGSETKNRKHIDWEIYSSMFNGSVNKQSGVLVVLLPPTISSANWVSHANEKQAVYPDVTNWITLQYRQEFENRYPLLPSRIIDNLITQKARISVTPWQRIHQSPECLRWLIAATHADKEGAEYDLSRPMRRADS